jgi:hypothetical protein
MAVWSQCAPQGTQPQGTQPQGIQVPRLPAGALQLPLLSLPALCCVQVFGSAPWHEVEEDHAVGDLMELTSTWVEVSRPAGPCWATPVCVLPLLCLM